MGFAKFLLLLAILVYNESTLVKINFESLLWPQNSSSSQFPIKSFSLISTTISNVDHRRDKRMGEKCYNLKILISKHYYEFCLEQVNDYKEMLDNSSEKLNLTEKIVVNETFDLKIVSGYTVTQTLKSFAIGYIAEDRFFGRIYIGNAIYYIEQAKNYKQLIDKFNLGERSNLAIIYEGSKENMNFDILLYNDSLRPYKKVPLILAQDLNREYSEEPIG